MEVDWPRGDAALRDFVEVEPGVWSVLDGTRSYEVRVSGAILIVNGRAVEVVIEDPRGWNPNKTRGAGRTGAQIKAPMPGKIVRVLVAVGDQVSSGQGVIVVEAMKMQNELKSPRDGQVSSVLVKPHETVNAGTVLITIE